MNNATEIWMPIPDYEGFYEVSNTGKIRSVYRYRRELKPIISNSGYKRVDLFKNKVRQQVSIHRIVAKVFCDNPFNKPCVNHKDENRLNNNANNLEWVTYKENRNYGTAEKRRRAHIDYSREIYKITARNNGKKTARPVSMFTKDGKYLKSFESAAEASRQTGIYITTITRAIKRGLNAGGYAWQYAKGGMTY